VLNQLGFAIETWLEGRQKRALYVALEFQLQHGDSFRLPSGAAGRSGARAWDRTPFWRAGQGLRRVGLRREQRVQSLDEGGDVAPHRWFEVRSVDRFVRICDALPHGLYVTSGVAHDRFARRWTECFDRLNTSHDAQCDGVKRDLIAEVRSPMSAPMLAQRVTTVPE